MALQTLTTASGSTVVRSFRLVHHPRTMYLVHQSSSCQWKTTFGSTEKNSPLFRPPCLYIYMWLTNCSLALNRFSEFVHSYLPAMPDPLVLTPATARWPKLCILDTATSPTQDYSQQYGPLPTDRFPTPILHCIGVGHMKISPTSTLCLFIHNSFISIPLFK
jgi:hypothetical protein